ncbi:hypothetical protein GWI33_008640 [Rhynchophorus ferrugineus]|uniref:Uncharacterized protein n=1 Tax=Rhynchophorus ferrugineus TaxID=354439 RepID=A0A834IHX7_RHYFE|nr:hypothetical protein GWI33_008640 [Rhynchophorus ferrugineus]
MRSQEPIDRIRFATYVTRLSSTMLNVTKDKERELEFNYEDSEVFDHVPVPDEFLPEELSTIVKLIEK